MLNNKAHFPNLLTSNKSLPDDIKISIQRQQEFERLAAFGPVDNSEIFDNLVKIRNISDNTIDVWSKGDLLKRINEDNATDEFNYDKSDWVEGFIQTAFRDYALVCENGSPLNDHTKEEKLIIAQSLWYEFEDTPIDVDDNLDWKFYQFDIGTDRFEVWRWFEDVYDLSVAKDLMYLDWSI